MVLAEAAKENEIATKKNKYFTIFNPFLRSQIKLLVCYPSKETETVTSESNMEIHGDDVKLPGGSRGAARFRVKRTP